MPCWKTAVSVRWCFFVKSRTAKHSALKLLAVYFVQVHLVYVEFIPLNRHIGQRTDFGPTLNIPNSPPTQTQAGAAGGELTVLSTGNAGCPHCQCSWQG